MSELYELPDGWEYKTLGKSYIVKDGTHDSPKYIKEDGYPLFTSKNLKDYGIDKDNYKLISEEDYQKINKRSKVDKGDLLFAMIGTIGSPTIVDFEPNFAIKNVALFKPKSIDNTIEILRYYFSSKTVIDKMIDEAKGATQKFVGLTYLRNFPFPNIPLAEQQHIVEKLDLLFEKIDKSIALHQKNMDEADVFMGSVLNDVFGELEEKNLPMLRFDTYTKLSRGHNPPKKDFIYEPKEGYVRFLQIRDGSSDKDAVYVPITKKLHLVTKDDLLLVAYRQVGKVFKDMEGAFNVALCKIMNNDYANLDTSYLYYLIQSKYVKGELLKRSERALIPSMSIEHLKSIEIPTPSLKIQQKVVKYLDQILEKTEKVKSVQKEKMESLKALKASILDRAFRGEL